jgi:carbonic anhydrase
MWHINCANFISFNSFQYYFLKFLTKNLKMMKNLVIFICSISLASAATSWGYDGENGPENWGGICNSGQSQSPINIDPSQVENASNLSSLEFINYNATGHVEVENNGHGGENEWNYEEMN